MTSGALDWLEPEITREEVRCLYKALLGREPESDAIIDWFRLEQRTFEAGRAYILRSTEYRNHNSADASPQYFIPEISIQPFPKSQQKLCLACIVKDEAASIANMLKSCAPLLDFAVLIDTGSSDNTQAVIAETLNGLSIRHSIHTCKFIDFAQARNEYLKLIPSNIDWVIVLDADEEIVAADYHRIVSLMNADERIGGWFLPRMNFTDASKRRPLASYPDFQQRLFRHSHDGKSRYVGAVHESLEITGQWHHAPFMRCETGEVGGPHIHHMGHLELDSAPWHKKNNLYTALRQGEGLARV